jgi:hypothetical protein
MAPALVPITNWTCAVVGGREGCSTPLCPQPELRSGRGSRCRAPFAARAGRTAHVYASLLHCRQEAGVRRERQEPRRKADVADYTAFSPHRGFGRRREVQRGGRWYRLQHCARPAPRRGPKPEPRRPRGPCARSRRPAPSDGRWHNQGACAGGGGQRTRERWAAHSDAPAASSGRSGAGQRPGERRGAGRAKVRGGQAGHRAGWSARSPPGQGWGGCCRAGARRGEAGETGAGLGDVPRELCGCEEDQSTATRHVAGSPPDPHTKRESRSPL